MNATHVDIPLAMISSAIPVLIAILCGGIWIFWNVENRKHKLHIIGVVIAIAVLQVFLMPFFRFMLEYLGLIPAILLYAINPLLLGTVYHLKKPSK